MINTLRRIKRRLLTGGFAGTVYLFLKKVKKEDGAFCHPDSQYLVNFSFDLELGFGTTFWEGNIEKALSYGKTARAKFIPIMKYLVQEKIPANVQIVGALLDPRVASLPVFSEKQRNIMARHKGLFRLTLEDIELLKSPCIEAGLHGFSHRHFTTLSPSEADYEMRNAVDIFEKSFGRKPEFMGFPKNCVAHTGVVKKYGIKCWRADTEHPQRKFEIPLGHWFAPGVLDHHDLKKLLSTIRDVRQGYLLHLWGHFTEMDVETFRELTEVIRDAGWEFTTIKSFKKY